MHLRLPVAFLAFASFVALASATVTAKFSDSRPLAPTGTVSVSNMNGDIEIVGWDKNEVSIEAEKKARDDEGLQQIEIIVEADAEHVSVKTKHQHDGDESWWRRHNNTYGSVHYTIHVPSALAHLKVHGMNSSISTEKVTGNVKLSTMNGRIHAVDLAADADLDTMNGRIMASLDRLQNGQKVSLDSMNGNCEVFVPSAASAHVSASSMNGHVSSELPLTVEKSSRRKLRGSLGKGEGSLSLDSMNGTLSIRART